MKTTFRFDRRRRIFLQRGAAAVVGPLLVSERTIAQTRTLYINSWGGSYTAAQEVAYFKPFTAATGIQIRTVTPVSYGKVKAQVQSGRYEFDMTSVNSMLWLRRMPLRPAISHKQLCQQSFKLPWRLSLPCSGFRAAAYRRRVLRQAAASLKRSRCGRDA